MFQSRLAGVFAVCVVAVALSGCPPTEVGPPQPGPCSISEPCADGLVCADGNCVSACTPDSCGAAGFCDELSGVCVQCRDNNDCGPGQVCNAFSNQCTGGGGGCTGNEDCDRGFCDVEKGSCVECLGDDTCGQGQVCDTLTNACITQQGCTSDFNCSGATPVCETASGVCVQCFDNVHCSSGACDTISRTCIAGCVDGDETEPNTTAEGGAAAPIQSGGEHSGAICPGDVDEFAFSGEGQISATLTIDGGRLTLTLLNEAGSVVATGTTSLNVADAPAGNYRLRVVGVDDAVTSDYILRLTVVAPSVCTELDTEPNNATFAAIALPSNGSLRSGTICGADTDFYSIATNAGDDVTVTLVAGTGTGTPTFTLESAAGAVLASGTATTPAVLEDAPGGALFVQVRATGGDVDYSLRATTSAAPPECVQTDPEPNDLPEQAQNVASGTLLTGQICAADVDQWRFTAANLDDVTVELTGSNVRARVFDAGGAVLGEGTSTFTLQNVAAGTYRVEVRGALSTTEAPYTLRVTLTPEPADDPCLEGGLEPDDVTPRVVAADGTVSAGRICAGDTDFFRFTLAAAAVVNISVRFIDADGDLDIRLRDGAGGLITTSAGVSDEERIVRDLAAGSYTVEVFGFSGAVNTYTVAVSTVSCTDDAFEPNNNASQALPIASRALSATRCPTDDDFFAIRLENGDALDARLVGAGLTMSLRSSDGTFLQGDAIDGANRRMQVSSLPAGRYLIRVTGSGAAPVNYTLTPTITPNPVRCVDDGAEPNNSTDTAFVIDASALADGSYDLSTLVMCDNNVDFFALDVPANRTMRVALNHALTSDLDIEILEQRGTSGIYRRIANAVSLTGVLDEVQGQVNAATRFIIRIPEFGTMPAAGLPYSVGIELSEPQNSSCVDDRFDTWTSSDDGASILRRNDAITDPNATDDIIIAPTPLSFPESLGNMRICSGNSDFFALGSLNAGERFQVDVTYVHAFGRDIDLRVMGPDGPDADTQVDTLPCTTCTGVSGNERFIGAAAITGQHFIEVFGFQAGENSYDLSITRLP